MHIGWAEYGYGLLGPISEDNGQPSDSQYFTAKGAVSAS